MGAEVESRGRSEIRGGLGVIVNFVLQSATARFAVARRGGSRLMPRSYMMRKRIRRRPPSDERALHGFTDPKIAKTVIAVAGVLSAFVTGVVLVVRGLI